MQKCPNLNCHTAQVPNWNALVQISKFYTHKFVIVILQILKVIISLGFFIEKLHFLPHVVGLTHPRNLQITSCKIPYIALRFIIF